ncbi:MAG: hypothetical protein VX589_10900 [Myxococcota bacterium]|nr:hypothetical protein [Myxococcota bacterium]
MRLRDASNRVREVMEGSAESLVGADSVHALVQNIGDVQSLYRNVESVGKSGGLVGWLTFSFEPFGGLIEPFSIYPARFWALQRIHSQPSGLPELVTHVARELPQPVETLRPHLYTSFSHSPNVETTIEEVSKEPITLRFFHSGNVLETDRSRLSREFCLPGIEQALPEGFIEDGIPGLVGDGDAQRIFLGDLTFYNGGRTPDRSQLCNFLLNNVAVGLVLRYVRDIVRKSMAQ